MKKILLPLLLVFANICIGQVDLNLGLRAYYPFSGNANDVSGNGNNPVFNNATLTADRFGNPNSAYHFNGTDSYMKINNNASLNTTNKLTLVAWVKPLGFYMGQCHGNSIMMKGDADYLTGNYLMRYDDNAYTNGTNCSNSTVDVVHQNFYGAGVQQAPPGYLPYIQTNQWYNIIVTYDGTTINLYIGCELKATAAQGTATFTNAYDLYFGKLNHSSFPYWLNGDLDEVRIYDRALTVDEVNVLGGCNITTACNTWLRTQALGQTVTLGDLDVSGDQMTIEATINRTEPYLPGNGDNCDGDVVTKHSNQTNVNYLLRPNHAFITTTNGFFATPEICNVELNKTYHIAMVYDGSFLKLYRNGFLMSQVPATGNLILNNFNAKIGLYAGSPTLSQFLGYTNEVRIWNVARTRAQIQSNMNSSLPNPPTQPGLLAYYTFDDLINKQGNATWNGTLNGGATINSINPDCTFNADSCAVTTSCNSWLNTPSVNSNARIGDLDITGNQITVEANFNASSPATPPANYGFLVSKHTAPGDINYALWPGGCAISTVNGDALITAPCPININKTYHTAMVYDGATLKFYRNGFLQSQQSITGNLINNNLITTIGLNVPETSGPLYQFFGTINEVRIWNVARTQAELQTYMNTSLPNPTSQTGLQGCYIFDNLLNKQGNVLYNATLSGAATINATNPNCTFTPDPVFIANAGNDSSYCSNSVITHQLQGSGNGDYSWSPAAYLNNPNIQNPVATISNTTTFYLTVSTVGNAACSAVDSVTIYVNPLPVVQAMNDTAICQNSPIILTTTSNATSFQWSPAGFVNNPAIANPSFIGATSQRMYVTGSTGPGCSTIDSVDVTVKPAPVINTINDTTLCVNQTVTLTTTGGQTYSWSPVTGLSNPNISNPVFSGNTGRTYTVTGIGSNGCPGTDMVTIDISSPASLKQPPSFSVCQKQAVQLQGNNGNWYNYLWSPATYLSSSTAVNPWASPPQTTVYTVVVTDAKCGFDSTFTALLTIIPAPVINARKSNDIDCAFRSATLLASGGNQYLWTPATGLSSTTIPNPIVKTTVTQKYRVRVTDAFGCSNTDSVTVFANQTASLARYMPNAFTPNGDGKNDCYGLKNWMYVKKLQFFIFNRFGEQVFATANAGNCWDGTYKGKPALAGTYVYVITAQTDCGTEEQKGSFLLIR